jgi:uncharacterized surface protein with fasciclin (FAS1) repeats
MKNLLAALSAVAMLAIATVGTSAAAVREEPAPTMNIVQTAAAAGRFDTLLALAKQAGLAGALTGNKKLTVFAPTDAAFANVPTTTLNELRRDRTALRRVLLYHVIAGNVKAAQVVRLRSAKTLAGPSVRIRVRGGDVFLNGTPKVVKTDIAATNGTIHVINRVLIPPAS